MDWLTWQTHAEFTVAGDAKRRRALAARVKAVIAKAEADGVTIDDGNVVDLVADNCLASIDDIRLAIAFAGFAARFPNAVIIRKSRLRA